MSIRQSNKKTKINSKSNSNKNDTSQNLKTLGAQSSIQKKLTQEYLTYLTDQNQRLEEMQKDLQQQMNKHQIEQQKEIEKLKNDLKEKENQINQCIKNNIEIEEEYKQLQSQNVVKIEEKKAYYEKQKLQKQQEIDDLGNQCRETEKFTHSQDILLLKLENDKKKIIEEQHEHHKKMELLEKRSKEESEIMKEKIRKGIQDTKHNVLSEIEDHLHPTTKRCIQATLNMEKELKNQKIEQQKLHMDNNNFLSLLQSLSFNIHESEHQIQSLASRSHFLSQLHKKINDRLKIVKTNADIENQKIAQQSLLLKNEEYQHGKKNKEYLQSLRYQIEEFNQRYRDSQERKSLNEIEYQFLLKKHQNILDRRLPLVRFLVHAFTQLPNSLSLPISSLHPIQREDVFNALIKSLLEVPQYAKIMNESKSSIYSISDSEDTFPDFSVRWSSVSLCSRSTQTQPINITET